MCLRILFLLLLAFPAAAQTIRGEVIDAADHIVISNVNVHNIHADIGLTTGPDGKFSIAARPGHLIEFRKIGYKTLRLRLPEGNLPEYFRITIHKGAIELPDFHLANKGKDYKKDSLRFRELYKSALEFEELTGLDAIRHPFSALSKKNRRVWAFQKEYNYFEQQKYIDYTFSEKLVKDLTGLQGDSAMVYLKKYRPTYEMLRAMNEYTFYSFVKATVSEYRSGRRYRQGINRSSQ